MAVKADGTLLIETGVDTDGFKLGCEKLQKAAKKAAKAVLDIEKNMETVMEQMASSSSETGSEAEAAKRKAASAAKEAKKAAREAKRAKKELDGLEDQEITITRMEAPGKNEYDGSLREPEEIDSRSLGYSREAMKAIGLEAEETKQHINVLRAEIQRAKEELREMEMEGKWFGDTDYDEAYTELRLLGQEIKEYQERLHTASIINPFDADSFAGKIREAEIALTKLAEAGKGLGDAEFDKAYRSLTLLKEEAKAYTKEIAKTPEQSQREKQLEEIGRTAKISKRRVVDLSKEMERLKERQKELRSAGVGPGYTEYDKNTRKISRMEKKLKRYEAAISGAGKKTKIFSGILSGAEKYISKLAGTIEKTSRTLIKGAGSGARAMAGLNRHAENTRLTMGKMLVTSLFFSTVFRLLTAVTTGIGEGFQNLAMYSDVTNASLSSLMSSMTRLKNSIAAAFSPLLTVASPILVAFINLLARALTYVGMFFAALTGKDSFEKAVGVQQDYRASLSDTAGSAKDAADATNKLAEATEKADKEKDNYLSGLDEIRRWETPDKGSDSGTGGIHGMNPSGGAGSVLPEDMFETVPIENSIKNLAKKIKKLLKEEDWEGLGELVAEELNKSMKHIYDVINWKKVGPKVTKFTKGFTTAFNRMNRDLDFDLAGRIIGAGINDMVNIFNLLVGPEGIDFDLIGSKLSRGLRGAVKEIGWTELGNLFGNYFMISWNMLSGFVTDMSQENGAGITGWEELGNSLGKAVNGTFDRIDFKKAGLALTGGMNGAFESLKVFTETVDWHEMADNVTEGLNSAFTNLNWKEAGASLDDFLGDLVGFLVQVLEETDWEEFGNGVGTFLGEIDWKSHLWKMVTGIAGAINEAFDGLEESGTAGKIVAFLGKAFIAVKISDITGIGSLIKKLVSVIGKKLVSKENITSVAGKLKELFGSGTSEAGDLLEDLGKSAGKASGGFSSLASSLGPLVGSAGLLAGVVVGVIELTEGLAGLFETFQGGNGKLTETGGGLHNFADGLLAANKITREQSEELYKLIENNESAMLSNEEMYNSLIEKLKEYGLSAADAKSVLESYGMAGTTTKAVVEALTSEVEELGTGMSDTAGKINMSGISMEDTWAAIRTSLDELSVSGGEFDGAYRGILMSLDETQSHSTTAQGALDSVVKKLQDAGIPVEDFLYLMGKEFPEAVQAAKTSAETNMAETQVKVSSSMKKAADDTAKSSEEIKKKTSENFSEVENVTDEKWGSSGEAVTGSLNSMIGESSAGMRKIYKNVESYTNSIWNVMSNTWDSIAQKIGNTLQNISSNTVNQFNQVIGSINNGISRINNAIGGIETAMNFGPWEVPTPFGTKKIGFHATFPRVSAVPYLAKGAVIPPNKEFMAVLGDQKHGTNIETPENLLRQIIRQELSSGGNAKGGDIKLTVQLNRRTIFEEMIEEAKVRQIQTGRNPFELS